MQMPSDDDLLRRVEEFLVASEMAPTRFGREAMGEASLVARMREGRSLSLRNANKLIAFMDGHSAAVENADTAGPQAPSSGKPAESSQQVTA